MPARSAARYASVIDVLERVLDKGIVIDAWVRVSLVGIDLLTLEARVVIASITTYLGTSEALAAIHQGPPPRSAALRPATDMSRHGRRARDGGRRRRA
jgi:gas vesicle structural protein